jgi:hypothetical protein
MPAPDHPDNPDPLDHLLDRLDKALPPAPGSVAPEVWRRIQQAERAAALPAPGWREHLHAAFGRTSFAAAFVVGCVLLGLFLAEVRSSRRQAEYSAQLAHSYLQLIDPLRGEMETRPGQKP